ncbi:MAG: D-aminoacyl-tRNA deacylase [Archaeoglobaceae archaeon]|nr:D-aminoacyl-tRNA deacylase [Archaeoglobaceae archaeon]MCX8151601.1 D-aminoacyl-tRNA deacylase [Archaeoglobaceae archaeon]MDW8013121.1 D-aminoacyl-tRNA deacylase [Archaeoglobaceae archaeon]
MKLVICSTKDPASMNIFEVLLTLENFDRKTFDNYTFHFSESFGIAVLDEKLIYADQIDKRLSKYCKFDEILFASRHSSKDGRKIFTTHVTGNLSNADFGGKPFSLAKPAPMTIKNYVLSLKEKIEGTGYEFSLEVTHHGPSEIKVPSAFFEIGSDESAWKDKLAAEVVAESIFDAINSKKYDWNVAVSVGGTHYAPRQTEIILETNITFGHNFAKYHFDDLTSDFLAKAVEISDAEMIVYDEKSVTSKIRSLILEAADRSKIEVLKASEAKKKFKS